MKKILKFIAKTLLCILGLIFLILIISFINHNIQQHLEEKILIPPGKIVEVNNHKVHIYVGGKKDSKYTLVFMAGSGNPSPYYDFRALFQLFENDYQVVVIEKAGYGYSEDSDKSRDIDTMLKEDREAIEKAGVNLNNLILLPHSMSGIEAIYWENKYETEVDAIIGLDLALPIAYDEVNDNAYDSIPFSEHISKFAIDSGLARFLPSIVDKMIPSFVRKDMTSEDKKIYKAIMYHSFSSNAVRNENKNIITNKNKAKNIDNRDLPMYFFISSEPGLGKKWQDIQINYLKNKTKGKYLILDCGHYVHDIEYQKIYDESKEFINNLE